MRCYCGHEEDDHGEMAVDEDGDPVDGTVTEDEIWVGWCYECDGECYFEESPDDDDE